MDINFALVTEAYLRRLAPYFQEVELGALRNFHPEQYPLAAVLAGVGALLASVLLYMIGVWLRRMPERVSTEEQQARIEKMRGTAREWLPWLLMLAPMPVGGIILIASGFFRMRPLLVAVIVVLAEVLWRAMPYLR